MHYVFVCCTIPVVKHEGKYRDALLHNIHFQRLKEEISKVVPNDPEAIQRDPLLPASANFLKQTFVTKHGDNIVGVTSSTSSVYYACYVCMGKQDFDDGNHYLNDYTDAAGHTEARLGSSWLNRRKKCTGRSREEDNTACENIMQRVLKRNADHRVQLHNVYQLVCKEPWISKAADHVAYLGGGCFVCYTCKKCRAAPANPSRWFRSVVPAHQDETGMTGSRHGSWYCPGGECFDRWSGHQGWCQRLLIWPRKVKEDGGKKNQGYGSELNMADLGNTPKEIEHMISVCKAATLLDQIFDHQTEEWVDVPYDAVTRVIRHVNRRSANELSRNFLTRRCRAVTKEQCDKRNIIPYCENLGISLHQFGMIYRSILIPPDLQPIDEGLRFTIFESLLMLFDLSQPCPRSDIKKAWQEARERCQRNERKLNIAEFMYPDGRQETNHRDHVCTHRRCSPGSATAGAHPPTLIGG